jgi:proteasome accessory factor C
VSARGPRSAQDRVRQLLVMLPWLMEQGEVPLADVADRFGMTEVQVTNDLELVAMCGLPPYVDEMIDVFVDDGTVHVGVPRLFTRPLRLTAPEGFALLAAGRAALELPGADREGALARGLGKLSAVLTAVGVGGDTPPAAGADDTAGVVVEVPRPPLLDAVAAAASKAAELSIDYYSPAHDAVASRTIVPRHVFVESGHWYVVADDDRSGERRTFRVDRIERAAPTGATVPTNDVVGAPDGFFTDSDVPRATVLLAPEARWIVEEYPTDAVTEVADRPGWLEVRLPVASERWLSRLLLRLGPRAEVVEPEPAARRAAELARAVLERYATC